MERINFPHQVLSQISTDAHSKQNRTEALQHIAHVLHNVAVWWHRGKLLGETAHPCFCTHVHV